MGKPLFLLTFLSIEIKNFTFKKPKIA